MARKRFSPGERVQVIRDGNVVGEGHVLRIGQPVNGFAYEVGPGTNGWNWCCQPWEVRAIPKAKRTPRGYRVMDNPYSRTLGGLGFRVAFTCATRKEARSYVKTHLAPLYANANGNIPRGCVKVEPIY